MSNSQWQLAWDLFETARTMPANEQRPFVESQGAPYEVVRHVLELLESPPEPDALVSPVAVCHTGTQVGRYLVGEILGRGGMGEVYAARDRELDRPVALKFLLPEEIGDPSAVKRFVSEAKAASALNHPNILTIHEIIQTTSSLAIVMERVEGAPLSDFRGAAHPLQQAVDLARQVAIALTAAHQAGIVHRDIKPENLMLRTDGFVKVLDFGLARRLSGPSVSAATISGRMPGGTLRYMSPEQLRDEPVTGASDVFSLGIVLYEFAAGRHPFEATYAWATAYAIHSRKPAPPSSANPAIPEWLDRLILSMLAQSPASRPSARDLVEQLARTVEPARVRRLRRWRYAGLVAAGVLALGAGAYGLRLKIASPIATPPHDPVPLTGMEGLELFPAFSPDGKQVVYSRDTGDAKPDLYLKLIGGGPPLRLPTTERGNLNPVWSPDGLQIAFLRTHGDVDRVFVSALGGEERLIGDITRHQSAERALTWSPDQKSLTVTSYIDGATSALWSLPLDGSARQRLTSPPAKHSDLAPAYSPDGKTLAFIRVTQGVNELFVMEKPGQERPIVTGLRVDSLAWSADGQSILFTTAGFNNRRFYRVMLHGGSPIRISDFAGAAIFNPTVASHGDRLAFTQIVPGSAEIMKLDLSGKEAARKLIASANQNVDPSFSPDNARIAFASSRTGTSQIWVSGSDGGNPVQMTSFEDNGHPGSPRWSPDGAQLAFDRDSKAGLEIYVVGAGGGRPRELISNGILPEWSPDGRWIYFNSNRNGSSEIWKAPSGGGAPIQVTHRGGFECFPSPDGRFLYYSKSRVAGIWRTPVDGGPEIEIPELRSIVRYRYWAGTSSGIYFYDPGKDPASASLKLYRFATGRVEVVLSPVPPPMDNARGLAISPDGHKALWVQVSQRISQILLVEGFR